MSMPQELIKGSVVPIILKLLTERPMYGYEMIQEINDRTDGVLEWKEGTLYPWLHRLEGDGALRSEWVTGSGPRRRKYYRVTRKGLAMLRERSSEWATFSQTVNALLCTPA